MKTSQEMTVYSRLTVLAASCGIRSHDEPALFKRLDELYRQGFIDGVDNLKALVDDVTNKLSKIVLAHIAGDVDQVNRLLDDMVRDHVKIVSEAPKTTH